jgi:hypothetical protein
VNDNIAYEPNARVNAPAVILGRWTVTESFGSPDLVASGPCVACGHNGSVQVIREVAAHELLPGTAPTPVSSLTWRFPCHCDQPHENRPATVVDGCGRWFLAAVEPDGAGWKLTNQVDETVLPAIEALEKEVSDEGSRLRTSAEKWTGAVTAISGLFGLAALVLAKDTVDKLPDVAKLILAALVLAAFVCAVLAIKHSYSAAYGRYKIADTGTTAKLMDWYAHRRDSDLAIPEKISKSVRLAIAGSALLLCGVFVIWFSPAKGPASLVTVTYHSSGEGSRTICGQIVSLKDGSLTLKADTPPRSDPTPIAVTVIDDVTAAKKC